METKASDDFLDPRIQKMCKKLQQIRKERGYKSYESFAFDNELPRVQYWRMEKGINFTMSSLLKVLDIHKITLDEFIKGIE